MIIDTLIATISFVFVALLYCAAFALCVHLNDENKKLKEIIRNNEEIHAYEQGRADAERDFQNSDYWNDYLAKIIADTRADALDHCEKCEIEQWDAIYRTEEKERAKVLDELLERLDFSFDGLISESTVRDTIAELKGKSNE